jgi:hypothetical protein
LIRAGRNGDRLDIDELRMLVVGLLNEFDCAATS